MEIHWWILIFLLGSLSLGILYAAFEDWLEDNDWI